MLILLYFLPVPPRPPLFLGLIHTECRILVPRPGIEPSLLTLEAWSLNHWTTSQGSPAVLFFNVLKYGSFFLSLSLFFFFWCYILEELNFPSFCVEIRFLSIAEVPRIRLFSKPVKILRTSMVIPWLRLHTARGRGPWFLGQETGSCVLQQRSKIPPAATGTSRHSQNK